MKNRKRILSVTLKRMIDESPDTSHLGEYANRPNSDFSIDRAHSEDCASIQPKTFDSIGEWSYWNGDAEELLDRVHSAICDNLPLDRELQPHGNFYLTEEMQTCETLNTLAESFDCDCHGGDIGRNEYRYFNPSFNYVNKDGNPSDGLTPEDVRKYTRQDYERMERMNAGNGCYIGIRAEAEIGILSQSRYVVLPNISLQTGKASPKDYLLQTITSGGLWGIESDSDRDYLESVEQDELADLRSQLKALGFSSRAISTAYKNVERKDS